VARIFNAGIDFGIDTNSSSFAVRDSRGSFRDTAKAIPQIKSGLPVTVFAALGDQLNITAEELAQIVGIAPHTLLRRKQAISCRHPRLFTR
jgi:Antitoxin Xre-like helix-turn-helix domain